MPTPYTLIATAIAESAPNELSLSVCRRMLDCAFEDREISLADARELERMIERKEAA